MKGNDYSLYLSSVDYFNFMCPIIHCLHLKIVKLLGKKDLFVSGTADFFSLSFFSRREIHLR